MMGRSHSYSGLAASLGAAAAVPATTLTGPEVGMAVFLAAVTGGAAVLPDIDHPDATVSKTFGPLTWLLSKFVRGVSGGHRNGTHSALGCSVLALAAFGATAVHTGDKGLLAHGLVAALVLAATAVPVWLLAAPNTQRCYKSEWGAPAAVTAMLALAVGCVVAVVAFGPIAATVALGLLLLLALSALVRAMRIPGGWDELAAVVAAAWAVWPEPWRPDSLPAPDLSLVPWALTVGAAVHCLGDAITKGGVPWAWPLTQANVGPQLILTDGPTERRVLVPIFIATIGVSLGVITGAWLLAVGVALWLVWLARKGEKATRRATARRKPAARRPAARKKTSTGSRKTAGRKR